MAGVTGSTLAEASFDPRVAGYWRLLVMGFLCITVVGIALIPFWLAFSFWYGAEYLRRVSARLTTQAVEIRTGVFFRKEITIPLNRITDVRVHDGPLMRHYHLRGLRVETAGSAGQNASSEGNLVGIIDAADFRDAILTQRQRAVGGEDAPAASAPTSADDGADANVTLREIRDILVRIEGRMADRDGG